MTPQRWALFWIHSYVLIISQEGKNPLSLKYPDVLKAFDSKSHIRMYTLVQK